jgi:hypothetical protein
MGSLSFDVYAQLTSDFTGFITQGECRAVTLFARGQDLMPSPALTTVTLTFGSTFALGGTQDSESFAPSGAGGTPGTPGGITFHATSACSGAGGATAQIAQGSSQSSIVYVKGVDPGNFTWTATGLYLIPFSSSGTVMPSDGGMSPDAGSGIDGGTCLPLNPCANSLNCCGGTCVMPDGSFMGFCM